ncbi:MAG: fused MFS/spermidine synthase [Candidatus Omnitrophota bacterium]|nr:fused MFS/spermidine synthase [Candidatus Omnitrophota bacterium]
MKTSLKLNASAFILGLTSMIGQIIIIRELLVVFYGNELSLGIILACWLFWVAFGSLIIGRLADFVSSKERFLSYVQLAISIIIPLNIFFIRFIKSILKIQSGQIIGLTQMLGVSFASLSIVCILLGLSFILIAKIAAKDSNLPSRQVAKIYLFESLGASVGGLLYTFLLIKTYTSFQNALILGNLNLIISILFNRNIIQMVYLVIFSTTVIFNWPKHLDGFTRSLQSRPMKLIENVDSLYGNIAVTKLGNDYSFYENGTLMFTGGDISTSEESVHYAMLEHPSPLKILLIGGGTGGSIAQILKHKIDRLDYVELDPMIISLSQKYMPPITDDRVNMIHMDGRLFVKDVSSANSLKIPYKYDVVILNLPDPYTASLNRFYSLEFFQEVKKILSYNGVFSFGLLSSENYISPEHAIYLSCIYNTLKKEFFDIKLLPGNTVTFVASNEPGMLTYDVNTIIKRLKDRAIKTKFVREYYIPFKLDPLRIKYVESTIAKFKNTQINTDFKPIGYLYHAILWISFFDATRNLLPYIDNINIGIFILIGFAFLLIALLAQKLTRASLKFPVLVSIGTTGMSQICFQVIILLAFQFIYGYMYHQIGFILASFMIGLTLGSFLATKIMEKIEDEKAVYIKSQAWSCLYPLILAIILLGISKINQFRPDIGNMLQIAFAIMPVISGFIGGFQFSLANKIWLGESKNVGRITGLLYGVDLLGSCIGGITIGVILIPLLGIIQTCILLSVINIFIFILLSNSKPCFIQKM